MFPFFYENRWYTECTSNQSPDGRPWCSVETKFENELWGFCPTNGLYCFVLYCTANPLILVLVAFKVNLGHLEHFVLDPQLFYRIHTAPTMDTV